MSEFKKGDRVRVIRATEIDSRVGVEVGGVFKISEEDYTNNGVGIYVNDSLKSYYMTEDQLEIVGDQLEIVEESENSLPVYDIIDTIEVELCDLNDKITQYHQLGYRVQVDILPDTITEYGGKYPLYYLKVLKILEQNKTTL